MARARRDAVEKREGHDVEVERPIEQSTEQTEQSVEQLIEESIVHIERPIEQFEQDEAAPAADPQPEVDITKHQMTYIMPESPPPQLSDPAFKTWVRREIALAAAGVDEESRKNLNP